MQLRRAIPQRDLFSTLPQRKPHTLPEATRIEVVQLLEGLLREVMRVQLRHGASLGADDEQDQR